MLTHDVPCKYSPDIHEMQFDPLEPLHVAHVTLHRLHTVSVVFVHARFKYVPAPHVEHEEQFVFWPPAHPPDLKLVPVTHDVHVLQTSSEVGVGAVDWYCDPEMHVV